MKLLILSICLLALSATTVRAEDIIYYTTAGERGTIMDWLISSGNPVPYDYTGCSMLYDGLATIGGEKNIAPQAGMKAALGKAWEERHFDQRGWLQGVVDFAPEPYFMTYAFVYIVCDQDTPATLATGSDDSLLVILNGQEVQHVQTQRGYAPDQEKVKVTLKKGWNHLLCKVDDIAGGHGLFARFLDDAGQPITNYKICLAAPKDPKGPLTFVEGTAYEAKANQRLKDASLSTTEGKQDEAISICREVVNQFSKSNAAAEALYQISNIQQQQNKTPDALKTIDELLERYPFSQWSANGLLAKAEILFPAGGKPQDSIAALKQLIDEHDDSALVPQAMLKLAAVYATQSQPDDSDTTLKAARTGFPNTVESVRALEMMGDNQNARGDSAGAKQIWQQTITEADALAQGKYVWFVNVQVKLQEISDRARQKIEGKVHGS